MPAILILQRSEMRPDLSIFGAVGGRRHHRDVHDARQAARVFGPVRRAVVDQVGPTSPGIVRPRGPEEPLPHSRTLGRRERPIRLVVVHPELAPPADGLRICRPHSFGIPRRSPHSTAIRLAGQGSPLVRRDRDGRVSRFRLVTALNRRSVWLIFGSPNLFHVFTSRMLSASSWRTSRSYSSLLDRTAPSRMVAHFIRSSDQVCSDFPWPRGWERARSTRFCRMGLVNLGGRSPAQFG